MPLPSGPCEIVSVYFFLLLPVATKGTPHILLFAGCFGGHTATYAKVAAEFTALGVAQILVNSSIRSGGYPVKLCPHHGLGGEGVSQ